MSEDFRAKVLPDDDSLIVEYEAQKKSGMKWDKDFRFITDEANEIPLYDSKRSDNQMRFRCPPKDVPSLLWLAWTTMKPGWWARTTMKPGMYSACVRANVEEVALYLGSLCISEEAAGWAAKKADQYYDDKIEFEEFVKAFRLGI